MTKEMKIALTGKIRSGKTTIEGYAVDKYGMVPFAFGDPLKRGFHKEYPHIKEHPKPVKGYQLYGQLMRYVHGENYWVNKVFNAIKEVEQMAINYDILDNQGSFKPIITDIRQQNELDRCKAEGFTIVRVHAPLSLRLERLKETGDSINEEDLNFETEIHVDDFEVDFEIINDGSLEKLYAQFDTVVEKIRQGS